MLKNKIKKIRESIIAIGFKLNQNQITIIGSGFCIDDKGTIATASHLYTQLKPEQRNEIVGMVMTKKDDNLEYYSWLPLQFKSKSDENDSAIFILKDHEKTLIKPIIIGDSDLVEVGDDLFFIGFPYAGQLINQGLGITLIANKSIMSNIKRDGVNPKHQRNWFIVDAISNPGNSGCPLIDIKSNKVVGIMTISFRMQSQVNPQLDIREPMHIAGAKPINLLKELL